MVVTFRQSQEDIARIGKHKELMDKERAMNHNRYNNIGALDDVPPEPKQPEQFVPQPGFAHYISDELFYEKVYTAVATGFAFRYINDTIDARDFNQKVHAIAADAVKFRKERESQ
jgi:hypothetical protein